MSRWCPACRREWPDGREACPTCLAELVDDLDATIVCRHCGTVCPSRMQSCPSCLGELRTHPDRRADSLTESLALGQRLPRPSDVAPFARGVDCTLLRTSARATLLYCGPDELVEAAVEGVDGDHRAVPPLRCTDLDGSMLFRLERYQAADDALVAFGADGASLATYLGVGGRRIHVRDETSAPAATLRPAHRPDADFELVETGGGLLARARPSTPTSTAGSTTSGRSESSPAPSCPSAGWRRWGCSWPPRSSSDARARCRGSSRLLAPMRAASTVPERPLVADRLEPAARVATFWLCPFADLPAQPARPARRGETTW